jgi:hypothetical protein
LRLGIAEAADHVDVIVWAHPEPDRVLLLHVDGHCPALWGDERCEVRLPRRFQMAGEDGIAGLERHHHALADGRMPLHRSVLVRPDERIGDER